MQKIINYDRSKSIDVQFEDGEILKNVTYQSFLNGSLMHPNYKHKSRLILGIGYNSGIKHYSGGYKYMVWYSILDRIYNKNHEFYYIYKNCIICDEWKDFQNFGDWYDINFVETFNIDKDILIKNNIIYSPDTCCFVPQEINKLLTNSKNRRGIYPIRVTKSKDKFTGAVLKFGNLISTGNYDTIEEAFNAYKISKEDHIKNVSNMWKHKINNKVYEALINYKVEITD